MDIYLHGIETIEKNDGPRPVETIDTGIIGLLGTAPLASADIWPYDTVVPVYGYSGLPGALGSTGTLAEAFDGIFDQATRASQTILAVRVREGATLAETMGNIIGNLASKTGMHALRNAPTDFNLVPKILIAPGFTSTKPTDGVSAIAISNGGSGYTEAPTVSIVGGGGSGASAVATINDDGEVDSITITNPGGGYSDEAVAAVGKVTFTAQPIAASTITIAGTSVEFVSDSATGNQVEIGATLAATLTALKTMLNASSDTNLVKATYDVSATELTITAATAGAGGNALTLATTVVGATVSGATLAGGGNAVAVSFSGGSGSGATGTVTLGTVANPVVAELLSLAKRFRAGVIADGPNTTAADAVAYRLDWNDPNLYIVDPQCKVFKDAAPANEPASARVAGLTARVDYDEGFWVSPSNHVIEGIIGASRTVEHSLGDPSVESQYLNKNGVATIVRSPSGGFKLWGSRAASADTLNLFWPVRRAHNTIIDSIERAHEPFIDKPFSLQVLIDIAETVNGAMRRWQALGATLGGRVWLDPSLNTKETWVAGHLYVSYDAEAPAPIEHITFMFSRNTGYYEVLAENAIREINRLSGRSL
jgi:phage tail sheath protein FI